jgi:membrane protein YdbS with pleckstrin-like domain
MRPVGISSRLLNEGERVVLHTRTHVKALLVPLLALVVLLAVGTSGQIWLPGTAALALWIVVGLLAVWLVLRPLLVWATATYTVTTRRLITRRGVLTRRGHDIPLSRISDVAYEFGLLDRLLGCGTLIVSDASTDGRVVLHDIPHVEQAQRRINDLLHDGDGAARGEGV